MIIIASIIEIFFSFTYYNVIFNKDYKKNAHIYLVFSVILGYFFNKISIIKGNLFTIIFGMIISLVISKVDKKQIILSSVEYLISVVLLFISEIVFGVIFITPIFSFVKIYIKVIVLFIVLLSMTYVYKVIIQKINYNIEDILSRNKVAWVMIINVVLFGLIVRVVVLKSTLNSIIYIESMFLLVVLMLVNMYTYRIIYKEIEEKKQLEIHKKYKIVLDELMDKFRANEHEYRNHINTINSIIQLEGSEILKDKTGNYIDSLENYDKYSKLMYVDNTIIKAVIFSKLQTCEQKNIKFTYNIKSNLKGCLLRDTDLSIVLNNLLNNAIEAVENLENKEINLDILEKEKFLIVIKNTIDNNRVIDVSELFKKGKSTKGKNRGFGLYIIRNIIESHKGTIQVSKSENSLVFQIAL